MAFPAPDEISRLLSSLIDSEYTRATAAVVTAIAQPAQDGRLALRLKEFADAAALGPVSPNSAVAAALLDEFEKTLRANRALMDSVSPSLASNAATAAGELTKQTMFAQDATISAAYRQPDPEAVAALVQYVDSAAWEQELGTYQTKNLDVAKNIIIAGFAAGQNPRTTAARLAESVKNLPRSTAEQIMRSTQLTSLRDAAVVHQVANADLIAYIVRVAALDDRTCLACVALHGKKLAVGERVNDHRNGRCVGIAVPKSRANEPFRQTYVVDGRDVAISSGEEWLRAHKTNWQKTFMGQGNYNAYAAGAVKLADFVKFYDDPLFGDAIQEASLKGILGGQAKDYYATNKNNLS